MYNGQLFFKVENEIVFQIGNYFSYYSMADTFSNIQKYHNVFLNTIVTDRMSDATDATLFSHEVDGVVVADEVLVASGCMPTNGPAGVRAFSSSSSMVS